MRKFSRRRGNIKLYKTRKNNNRNTKNKKKTLQKKRFSKKYKKNYKLSGGGDKRKERTPEDEKNHRLKYLGMLIKKYILISNNDFNHYYNMFNNNKTNTDNNKTNTDNNKTNTKKKTENILELLKYLKTKIPETKEERDKFDKFLRWYNVKERKNASGKPTGNYEAVDTTNSKISEEEKTKAYNMTNVVFNFINKMLEHHHKKRKSKHSAEKTVRTEEEEEKKILPPMIHNHSINDEVKRNRLNLLNELQNRINVVRRKINT